MAAIVASLVAAPARAQTAASPQDVAIAEKAFNEGAALAQAGNCKDAVVKLELSQKIDPASGTALYLGKCYESLGRTASAYGAYSQSAGLARVKVNDRIRAEAESRMAAIQPQLSNLELRPPAGWRAPDGLRVAIDGKAIASAALGVAIPVDPGTRSVEVSAPGHRPWKSDVQVTAPGTVALPLPALEALPPAAPAPGSNGAPNGMSTGALAATIGLAGVGAAAIGVTIGFGVDSMDKNAASKKLCLPADETQCSAEGVDLRNKAFSSATASNVALGIGVGALAAAGGVLLYSRLTSGRSSTGRGPGVTAIAVGPTGLAVQGRF